MLVRPSFFFYFLFVCICVTTIINALSDVDTVGAGISLILIWGLCFIYNKQAITWSLIYGRAREQSKLAQSSCLATPTYCHLSLQKLLTSTLDCTIIVSLWNNVKVTFSEPTSQALNLRNTWFLTCSCGIPATSIRIRCYCRMEYLIFLRPLLFNVAPPSSSTRLLCVIHRELSYALNQNVQATSRYPWMKS